MQKARSASRGIDLLQKRRKAIDSLISKVSSIREYLETCHLRFRPEAAKQLTAVIQVTLKDKAAGVKHHFHLDIDKVRGCFLQEGKHPSPSVTLKTSVNNFLKISNGELNAYSAVAKGTARVLGSADLQMKLFSIMPSRPKLTSPKTIKEVDPTTCPKAQQYQGTYKVGGLHFSSDDMGAQLLFFAGDWPIIDTKMAVYGDTEDCVYLFAMEVTFTDGITSIPEVWPVMKFLKPELGNDRDEFAIGTDEMSSSYAFELYTSSDSYHFRGHEYGTDLGNDKTPAERLAYVPHKELSPYQTPNATVVTPSYKKLLETYYWDGNDIELSGYYLRNFFADVYEKSKYTFDGVNFDNSVLYFALFGSAKLLGVTFKGCNLTSSAFGPTTVSTTEFDSAILDYSNLNQTEFVDVSFKDASIVFSLIKRATFSSTDFDSANLPKTIFSDSQFTKVSLKSTNLKNTKFIRCKFIDTVFDGSSALETADFTDAQFTGVSMRGINATNAKINTPLNYNNSPDHMTNLKDATLPYTILKKDWSYMDLEGATLTGLPEDLSNLNAIGAKIPGQTFQNVNFSGATLQDANLADATFVDCDLTGAVINSGTNCDGTNFIGSIFTNANMSGAQLGRTSDRDAAIFTRAYLTNVNLSSANLFQTNLSHAQLYGDQTNLDGANLQEADLTSSNLGSASFAGVTLSGAVLDNAVLTGCDMTNTVLSGTDTTSAASLVGASLQGADFTGAQLHDVNMTNAAVAMEKGVPLFSIDAATYTADLDSGTLSDDLRNEFTTKNFPLTNETKIDQTPSDSEWQVVDSSQDVPAGTYSLFNLALLEDNTNIRVYGKEVVIERLTSTETGGQLEIVRFGCAPTVISADNFNDSTVCPNGIKYGPQKPAVAFEEMMIAETILAPPECIPTPTTWCP